MGEVFRADDIVLGQTVALKFLPEAAHRNESLLARFYDEVRIARQISHANVCRVYDIGEIEGQPYLSMEYIDGEDLSSLLRRIGRLPGDKAAEFARKMCAGLAAAHAQGVLHRDIKPGNIMIDGRGEPRITDFGLAALGTIEGNEIRNGTPAYMAPEQLEGREVSAQSDIYALGLVFHEMFTGKPAHDADTVAELTKLRRTSTTNSVSTLVGDIDPAAERAIQACLQPDPKLRPKSALDLARMLPGGDPLAAALAAGQTPSPEMVAASGTSGAMRPKIAFAILTGTIALVLGGMPLASYMSLHNRLPLQNPPDVLTARARDVAQQLGYTAPVVDWQTGFVRDQGLIDFLRDHIKTFPDWEEAVKQPPTFVDFWYRSSPRALNSISINSESQVTPEDPPATVPGMTYVSLSLDGRLRRFQAVPPRTTDANPSVTPVDWPRVFALAKLDISKFQPTSPQWTSLTASDQRLAWTGFYPVHYKLPIQIPIRVEAAAFQGKPVYFEILGPWDKPVKSGAMPAKSWGEIATGYLLLVVLTLLIGGASLLAWHHWKTARGDRAGAVRVGLFVTTFQTAAWILRAHHYDLGSEADQFGYMAGSALFVLALSWVFYLALEPWVRRYWPQVLVTSTRILRNDWKNPQVGRDALIGTALGVLFITYIAVMQLFVLRSGQNGPEGLYLGNFLGMRYVLGLFSSYLGSAITSVTGLLLFGLFLRGILRREWLVGIAFVLIMAFFQSRNETRLAYWPFFLVNAGNYVIVALAILRLGMFGSIVMIFVTNMLGDGLMTTDFSAWYGTSSWVAIVLTFALALWGYRVATAGQSLLGDPAAKS